MTPAPQAAGVLFSAEVAALPPSGVCRVGRPRARLPLWLRNPRSELGRRSSFGVKEKTALVHLGLEALISKMSAARLARLGGTERKVKAVPRLRTA